MNRIAIFVALLVLISPAPATAQTLLRWKLKTGDSLAVDVSKQTQTQVDLNGKSAITKIDLAMHLAWQVTTADERAIHVKQTIDQIRATLSTPAGTAEFDSSDKTRAAGLAKKLAESLQPLIGAEMDVIFTPRGEVESAAPANDLAQKLLAKTDTKLDDPAAAPRDSLVSLLSQSILQLPEKAVSPGDHWTIERQIPSDSGSLKLETSYALEKILDQDNSTIAKIKTSARLIQEPPPGQKAPGAVRILSNEQTGSASFAIHEGRPLEVAQNQLLKTQRTYRDATIDVTLESHTNTMFRAGDEKK